MIIGSFTYDREKDSYTGGIVSLNFRVDAVTFRPMPPTTDSSPDYRVIAKTPFGDIELGAAWHRISDKKTKFVSVSLDGPLLARPFNAALFPDDGGTTASLVWNRARPKRNGAATTSDTPIAEEAVA